MEKSRLGMLLFIASESVFFVLLVLAYVNYHTAAGNGPTAASTLDTMRTAFFSLFLFASSGTVWLAGRSLRRGSRRGLTVWLIVTAALGAVFLVGQGMEYRGLLDRGVTISRDLFGTTFFTLTGFHGLHVFLGLVMLGVLAGLAIRSRTGAPARVAVECVSMYWHFVDVVWVVIFSVVYLWAAS